ncbi:hypothetical protein B0H67DRAFT_678614 [Lasiosphaeris hirsuta]|uniref:Uncharacterized protein n=1 Tax=Lasiosphaeris hirsuta TaxID=260670 RepID=A0AA40BB02_9PEZI|nr:hypothetical protein B0H67DRAFT_678614 [Lasiosphaeris hirsuta]
MAKKSETTWRRTYIRKMASPYRARLVSWVIDYTEERSCGSFAVELMQSLCFMTVTMAVVLQLRPRRKPGYVSLPLTSPITFFVSIVFPFIGITTFYMPTLIRRLTGGQFRSVEAALFGVEGGMQRAIACSYDYTTQTFYRETGAHGDDRAGQDGAGGQVPHRYPKAPIQCEEEALLVMGVSVKTQESPG